MSETNKTKFFLSSYGINKLEGCEVVAGAIDKSQAAICKIVMKGLNIENQPNSSLDSHNFDDNHFDSILQNLIILGKCDEEVGKKEKVFQLIMFLLSSMSDGESMLLVIDDTQNILMSLTEQTRILSRMEAEKGKLLNVIILDRKKRIQSLHSPQFKQACMRAFVRQKPDKLKADEIVENIENRLTMGDSTEGIYFSTEALVFIRNNSLGISCMADLMLKNVHLRLHSKKVEDEKDKIVESAVERPRFPKEEIVKKEEYLINKIGQGTKNSGLQKHADKYNMDEDKPLQRKEKIGVCLDNSSSRRDTEDLKKIYLICFGILAIIVVGVVINLLSSKRTVKDDLGSTYTSTVPLEANDKSLAIQDMFKIARDNFASEIEFRKYLREAVISYNSKVEQRAPGYQAATANLSMDGHGIESGKLSLSINWNLMANQLDREGYIVVSNDQIDALLKEGEQKSVYIYFGIVEDALVIKKIVLIGLEEEIVVLFWPCGVVKYDPVSGMQFVWIPGRSFTMGSNATDEDGLSSEKPAHEVFINGFWIGMYEVTQAQWEWVVGPNNWKSGIELTSQDTSNCPVRIFNEEFLLKLNERANGDIYRLPSEAEWEYAARAGSSGKYCFGEDVSKLNEYAWNWKNSEGAVHPVGQLKPNRWGLYDMHGNVSELCGDTWHSNYDNAPIDGSVWKGGYETISVVRGGGIKDPLGFLRCASRSVSNNYGVLPFYQQVGFRLVRSGGFLD